MREQGRLLEGPLSRSFSVAVARQLLYGHDPREFARFVKSSTGMNTKPVVSFATLSPLLYGHGQRDCIEDSCT